MSYADHRAGWTRERAVSMTAVVLVHAALLFALLKGLGVPVEKVVETPFEVFDISLPQPEPEVPPPQVREERAPREEGEAAPPALEAKAKPIVAPEPVVPLPVPSPLPAPTVANTGTQTSQGAAPVPGPGTGAGGVGDGFGAGGRGTGPGGGGYGGRPLRRLSGAIMDSDYPPAAMRAGASGVVGIRFTVGIEGRITACRVIRSSGNGDLDRATCPLLAKRLRYRPALDAQGRPYAETVTGEHEWNFEREGDGWDDER